MSETEEDLAPSFPEEARFRLAKLRVSHLQAALAERDAQLRAAGHALERFEAASNSRLWRMVQAIRAQIAARRWLQRMVFLRRTHAMAPRRR